MAARATFHHAHSGPDPAPAYVRHRPEQTLLYQIVAQHYPAFRAQRAGRAQRTGESTTKRHRAMTWMQRLKRVFKIDVQTCRHSGGTVKIISCIEDPEVIARILEHLERTAVPQLTDHAPRAPPQSDRL